MAGQPDPKPVRVRGKLPTIRELGGYCQVCQWHPPQDKQAPPWLERMHLLRGSRKEDIPQLLMVGCGDFGRCRIHPRFDQGRGGDRIVAAVEIRNAMYQAQEDAVRARLGEAFDDHFPVGGVVGGEFTVVRP